MAAGRRWDSANTPSFTEFLKEEAGEVWTAATHHPMTDAFADGTIPREKLTRYLLEDHLFLDAFTALLASATAATPRLRDRIPLAQFNALLLGPENTYFTRSFQALGVTDKERADAEANPAAPTAAFIRLMQSVRANGSLNEMLAVLVVAEWSYLEWGERVALTPDLPFWCREWVELHRGAAFAGVVAHLRAMLDEHASSQSASSDLIRVRSVFLEAAALELDFWDMAWGDEAPAVRGQRGKAEAAAATAAGISSASGGDSAGGTCAAGRGLAMLQRLRQEPFNVRTEAALAAHPYLVAAEEGRLSLAQRRAFAGEQFSIQRSDAASFAALAGHPPFTPASLASAKAPPPVSSGSGGGGGGVDLFQFLLEGEVYAAPLLLAHARSLGLSEAGLVAHNATSGAQAYPSYWARLALARDRASGAAACAVNFPAWGALCARLGRALAHMPEYQTRSRGSSIEQHGNDDAPPSNATSPLAFVDFFGTPVVGLDAMAAAIIEAECASYDDLVTPVRLLQEYELSFWDAIYEAH
eukprot:CAMPEP_0171933282 /NCGR_PEP_ID=MMETSP0993-20121228/31107_1 /TAXON_ID=483369 /ORGANISM="non described non described, Strain CCMP2098" /LENGTH=527 /DNA_ID=CAMNT_0012573747 /DNA_START=95 /DNA_END=1678 /DNA_ORIENTATION=+